MTNINLLKLATNFTFVVFAALVAGAQAQAPPSTAQTAGGPAAEGRATLSGKAIMGAIAQIEGCLGVDSGEWDSGKQTIIAWFEDKDAVVSWYDSDMHMQMIESFTDDDGTHEPLEFVRNDSGPIMVMATLTYAEEPHFEGLTLPVSQISVELFAPLPGGAHLGGRLAPPAFKVPHMNHLGQEELQPVGR